MADRFDYYFRQKVTESELDDGFAAMEQADFDQFIDHGLTGLIEGLDVSENAGTPNLTVDIAAGTAYSKAGERMRVGAQQDLDVSVDDSAVSTAVGSGGNEKIVSVFILFDRILTDPRIDGNSITVFFSRAESFQFSVIQGAEAGAGTAVPPALDPDKILLADITRTFGQTQIFDADIDLTRRETVFNITAGSVVINTGQLRQAVTDIAQALDDHITGVGAAHPTSAIDGAADTVGDASVTAVTLDNQINEILTEINDRVSRTLLDNDSMAGGLELGTGLLGTLANLVKPRLRTDIGLAATNSRTLIQFFDNGLNGVQDVRIYAFAAAAPTYEIAIGCSWNEGTGEWQEQTNPSTAVVIEIGVGGVVFKFKNTGPDPSWTDAQWDTESIYGINAQIDDALSTIPAIYQILNAQGGLNGSNIDHDLATTKNALYASGIVKAWGNIGIDGSGNVTNTEGLNFSTPANPGASSVMSVNFVTAMDDGEYAVVVFPMTSADFAAFAASEVAGSFSIVLRTMSTGALLNYDAVPVGSFDLGFIVLAKQT